MEMPINVIITLFIVIAVGTMIVVFAQQQLGEAQNAIDQFNPASPDQKDRILEVKAITDGQIAFAVKECMKEFYSKSFENQYCTIFKKTTSGSYSLDNSAKTAIYLELAKYPELYDTSGDKVVQNPAEINAFTCIDPANNCPATIATPLSGTVFFIKWNGEQTRVEVTT